MIWLVWFIISQIDPLPICYFWFQMLIRPCPIPFNTKNLGHKMNIGVRWETKSFIFRDCSIFVMAPPRYLIPNFFVSVVIVPP